MKRMQIIKKILEEWCEKNMHVHTDWTGARVESNNTCDSLDEFVNKLYDYLVWRYLEEESNKID